MKYPFEDGDYILGRELKAVLETFKAELAAESKPFETDDIENLSDEALNALKCGDRVIKVTGDMKHAYIVTYKEEGKGICISYYAKGYLETISYDCADGHWTFNDKEVWEA